VPFNPSAGSYRRRRVFGAERGMSFCTSLYCAIAVERRSVSLFSCLAGKFTIVHPRKARLRLQYQVHIPDTRPYGTFHCSQVPGMVDQAFNDIGGSCCVIESPRNGFKLQVPIGNGNFDHHVGEDILEMVPWSS